MPRATTSRKPAATEAGPRRAGPLFFLIHDAKDDVGVAVVDIEQGRQATGLFLDTREPLTLESLADIPLGHKIALRDFRKGDTVTKYGQDIGKVVAPIRKGEHVHVHNVKTKRW